MSTVGHSSKGARVKPLTPKMLTVLRELAKPGARASYMPCMGRFNPNPYYYLTGPSSYDGSWARCTAQVLALKSRGLLDQVNENPLNDAHFVVINDAGRKVLKDSCSNRC